MLGCVAEDSRSDNKFDSREKLLKVYKQVFASVPGLRGVDF